MKNKDFTKFSKRNTHKRRAKEAARAELLRAVRQVEESYSGFKIRDSYDGGPRRKEEARPQNKNLSARGIFSSSRSGFGFVKTDKYEKDIFIPENKTRGAIDGDEVEIVFHTFKGFDGEERTEGRVVEILEFGRKEIIGTFDEEIRRHGRRTYRSEIIIPDDPRLTITPWVHDSMGAEVGDKVVAKLLRTQNGPECRVIKILGHTESKEANYEAILTECEIKTEFSPEELKEAEELAKAPLVHIGRKTFNEPIFTIDGEGAKDLDDAVSVKKTDSGYILGVHIADVSEYVTERTALDRCVTARGTSVYFADKVVPMLPPALSNGACSLNPNEEKYTLSAIIELDRQGEIINTEILSSIIKSSVRGVYSEVNRIFENDANEELLQKYFSVKDSLNIMRELFEILLKRRKALGYIDFNTDDAIIILNENGHPVGVEKRSRGVAERMIEQFMLMANEAVATKLTELDIPCVYRIHEPPEKEKFSEFVNYAHTLGFNTSEITKRELTPTALQSLLAIAEERGNLTEVSYAMLRAMSKARYSAEKSMHFGLGMELYCHFTSPIRRLSDLATHRIIKRVLFENKPPQRYSAYARRAAAAATEGEERAEEAERRIENLYKAFYMLDHMGEEFEGTVSSVTQYGLFCRLENTCEGLIPINDLGGEFIFDEKTLTLRSRNHSYKIADKLKVITEEVDVIGGKLRFSIVE